MKSKFSYLSALDGWNGHIKMSLRAKCLPQKSGPQLSSAPTKQQPTLNTSVKQTLSNHHIVRNREISLKRQHQLKSTRSNRTIVTLRNGRKILKYKHTTTKLPSKTSIKKTLPNEKQEGPASANNKTNQIKTCTKNKLENTASSINCSRSGRKLVPARCACANDSVTTRCSIHNNVRKTAISSSSPIEPKPLPNICNNTEKDSQEILR